MSTRNGRSVAAKSATRRLRGGWLAVTRVVWILVATTTLGLFALSVPPGYALLRTVCTERPCSPEQLIPEGARTIEGIGLPLDWYAAYGSFASSA